jgi:hypothetical protein
MQTTNLIEQKILNFGYGIYHLTNGDVVIADPIDNEDGFYLEGSEQEYPQMLEEACQYIGC